MAKVKEVTASLARLIALPRYENIRFESSITMSLEEGDIHEEVYKDAMAACRANIRAQIERFNNQEDD